MIKGRLCFHNVGLTILELTGDHSLIINMEFEREVVAQGRGGKPLDGLGFLLLRWSRVDLRETRVW
jgi:hypothetical protein